ncbi:hypothetical protein [Cohaesibacter celericrescens]|uniref:Uncharacterized protein n=1 Tax=Cohaesibacter celericrescens TaxID=2067669 RepID=A0A2N5XQ41_9HYPH|nr:hypothetical protein [Cohaesibacter celericrescens]PLW76538.1 hypothetical protein C0081_14110 [Cohaesibacter celericrescens]
MRISISGEAEENILEYPDANGTAISLSGGMRLTLYDEDKWVMEPVLKGGLSKRIGFIATADRSSFLSQLNLTPICIQRYGWYKGDRSASTFPIVNAYKNHFPSPAELWMNISNNMTPSEKYNQLSECRFDEIKQIEEILNQQSDIQALAKNIGMSLRSLDHCVEQIHEFYYERLTHLITKPYNPKNLYGSRIIDWLFATVHSFFVHFGCARDYFASLIARRLGLKSRVDDFGRLLNNLDPELHSHDELIQLLLKLGYLQPEAGKSAKFVRSGWLDSACELRRIMVHVRPYGGKFSEQSGRIERLDKKQGIFKYVHPFETDVDKFDVLDLVVHHYKLTSHLFKLAAESSGYDSSLLTLQASDIKAISVSEQS